MPPRPATRPPCRGSQPGDFLKTRRLRSSPARSRSRRRRAPLSGLNRALREGQVPSRTKPAPPAGQNSSVNQASPAGRFPLSPVRSGRTAPTWPTARSTAATTALPKTSWLISTARAWPPWLRPAPIFWPVRPSPVLLKRAPSSGCWRNSPTPRPGSVSAPETDATTARGSRLQLSLDSWTAFRRWSQSGSTAPRRSTSRNW